ncbi:MAG: GTP-binding protein, partial [Clostridia bacterium]|nr:GTP-binding protein [Clostridia bacterium]
MTKVDIFSGFLGAGKTTLIKKLLSEAYAGQKIVLIENEFGEIGIDGGFMADAGIQVNELNSGCICCSLVGDFAEALKKVVEEYSPDRILIEPSGVGKLSDIITAVTGVEGMEVNSATAVCDASKCKVYLKNFGEFYKDQIKTAGAIVLSRTGGISEEKLAAALELIRGINSEAIIITTPWDKLDGKQILEAMEQKDTIAQAVAKLAEEHDDHEHHHHDHDECDCHDHEHHHHHHDHDGCCCHEHEHHHHHHADDVFASVGAETTRKYTLSDIETALGKLADAEKYGTVLRAKGIVEGADGEWIHFDYVPGEPDVRRGSAGITGRLCVIGAEINETE